MPGVGGDVEKTAALCTVGGIVNGATAMENVWQFLKKLKTESSYDPAIPLLSIYSKELKTGS